MFVVSSRWSQSDALAALAPAIELQEIKGISVFETI